jgi:predicted transcriptional regulator YdeE
MKKEKIEGFTIVGLAVRTTNESGQAATDIPALWNKFITENIFTKIPNKTDQQIYCMYTDYEGDFTKPYTTILGCKVANNTAKLPDGLVRKFIPTANYTKVVATGNLQDGAVYKAWVNIWEADINRAYQSDFEIYGSGAQDPNNGSVDIYLSIN